MCFMPRNLTLRLSVCPEQDATSPAGYAELPAGLRAQREIGSTDLATMLPAGGRMTLSPDEPNRREFCKYLASAAVGTAGLAILPGCSGNSMNSIPGSPLATVSGTVSNGVVTVNVATGPLASSGGMALVDSAGGQFLVTRTGASTFVALTAQCTHQACVVSLGTGTSFVCPCHGSEFDTSGHVLVGPAFVPLRQFQTQFANNVLTIS
jgi:cytochrome b6-f complex iron-sulfur subunit